MAENTLNIIADKIRTMKKDLASPDVGTGNEPKEPTLVLPNKKDFKNIGTYSKAVVMPQKIGEVFSSNNPPSTATTMNPPVSVKPTAEEKKTEEKPQPISQKPKEEKKVVPSFGFKEDKLPIAKKEPEKSNALFQKEKTVFIPENEQNADLNISYGMEGKDLGTPYRAPTPVPEPPMAPPTLRLPEIEPVPAPQPLEELRIEEPEADFANQGIESRKFEEEEQEIIMPGPMPSKFEEERKNNLEEIPRFMEDAAEPIPIFDSMENLAPEESEENILAEEFVIPPQNLPIENAEEEIKLPPERKEKKQSGGISFDSLVPEEEGEEAEVSAEDAEEARKQREMERLLGFITPPPKLSKKAVKPVRKESLPTFKEEIKKEEPVKILDKSGEKKKEEKKEEEKKEESAEIQKIMEAAKNETPEEKLRKITDLVIEIEQNLVQTSEDKAPFEKRKKEIEEEIEKVKKRLELVVERKKRIDEIKQKAEEKEESAEDREEKRKMEKERWKVEDERYTVEQEKNQKEDELKSLRLQLKEIDLNLDKVLSREKELNMELDLLKKDRQKIIIGEQKKGDLTELEKIENEAIEIKDQMNENTAKKEEITKKLDDIVAKERSIEEEIKVLEKRSGMTILDDEAKRIEETRKSSEEKRRQKEEERWQIEDELKKVEQNRGELREKYQVLMAEIRTIKEKLATLNKKLDEQNE